MKTVGIVAEYNPFHAGHRKQFDCVKAQLGEETAIVCAMSGNFVQRGAPAVLDKTLRAKAAIACGADLVVELPTPVSLSSAEGFAAGGVGILSKLCDTLCFGAETGEAELLMETARALLSEDFSPLLRRELDGGKSFPAARAEALAQMGLSGEILRRPNDILAVEYCKAILAQRSPMVPFPIRREGCYHDRTPDRENPSATAVRRLMLEGGAWDSFVPESARAIFENAPLHSLAAGERAILARLRTMTDAEFEALFPTPDIEWWTYEGYKEWLDNEKANLQSMLGGKGWTSSEGEFIWTQEKIDETIALYETILTEIKNGVMYSKTVDGQEDTVISCNPADQAMGVSTEG